MYASIINQQIIYLSHKSSAHHCIAIHDEMQGGVGYYQADHYFYRVTKKAPKGYTYKQSPNNRNSIVFVSIIIKFTVFIVFGLITEYLA